MCFCTVTSIAYQTTRAAIRSGVKTHGSTMPLQATWVSPQEEKGHRSVPRDWLPFPASPEDGFAGGWVVSVPCVEQGLLSSTLSWRQPTPYRPPPQEPGSLRKQLSPHVGSLHEAGASSELLHSCRKHPFTQNVTVQGGSM